MHTRCNNCVAISVRGNQDEDAVEGLLSTEAFPRCSVGGAVGAEVWGEEDGRWVHTASSVGGSPPLHSWPYLHVCAGLYSVVEELPTCCVYRA